MLKNIEDRFSKYCNSENFEINKNQLLVIQKLKDYHEKNHKSFFFQFFSKDYPKKSFYLYGDVGL